MPLVRIHVPQATPADDRRAVADTVHDALVAHFNVPVADRFQVIQAHADGELICTPEYLGIRHTLRVGSTRAICSYSAFFAATVRPSLAVIWMNTTRGV